MSEGERSLIVAINNFRLFCGHIQKLSVFLGEPALIRYFAHSAIIEIHLEHLEQCLWSHDLPLHFHFSHSNSINNYLLTVLIGLNS